MSNVYISVHIRKAVLLLAGGYCEYCKMPKDFSAVPFEMEHIISIFHDGQTIFENIAWACRSCNNAKSSKIFGIDIITGKQIPFFNPRTQNWIDHFRWSDDFLTIIGVSAIGKVTVTALKMNRPEHINFRRLLIMDDEHPPKENL